MKRVLLFCLLLILAVPLQVFAYVYPPGYVYKRWMRNNRKVHSLSYDKLYYALEKNGRKSALVKKEQVFIRRHGLVRVWDARNNIDKRIDLQRAVIIDRGQKRKISVDQVLSPLEMLWAYKDEDALMLRINQFFTSTAKFQWFLLDGQKHWMQGEAKANFLLFSIDEFRPVVVKQQGQIMQFLYPKSATSSANLPQKIIQFDQQVPIYEVLIENIKVNLKLDSRYFSTS